MGPQVMGMVEGLLPQKHAHPVPATPTHAEMVARLHELYASEKRLPKKVEEAKGRLEKAKAEVFEEEEVDGELQGVTDQIKALSRRRRKGRRGGGERRGLAVMMWKTVPLWRRRAALKRWGLGWKLVRGGRLPDRSVVFLGRQGGVGR